MNPNSSPAPSSPGPRRRKPLSVRLRESRTKRGLTQCQLAELLGVTQGTVWKIEAGAFKRGRRWVGYEPAAAWAEVIEQWVETGQLPDNRPTCEPTRLLPANEDAPGKTNSKIPLHERLRETRMLRGLSQTQLAERLHVDHKTIGHWERGPELSGDGKQGYAIPVAFRELVERWIATGKQPTEEEVRRAKFIIIRARGFEDIAIDQLQPISISAGPEYDPTLHERLRATRVARKLSMDRLAKLLQVHSMTIRAWEHGPVSGYRIPLAWHRIVGDWVERGTVPTHEQVERAKTAAITATVSSQYGEKLTQLSAETPWQQLVDCFLREATVELCPAGRDNYRHILGIFGRVADPKIATDLNERTIGFHVSRMLQLGRTHATVNSHLRHIKRFSGWLVDVGALVKRPRIKMLLVARKVPRRISEEQFERLLARAPDDVWRAFFLTAWLTGLRYSELLGLVWSDLDLDQGRILVRAEVSKAKRCDDWVPINSTLNAALEKLPKGRRGQRVFDLGGAKRTVFRVIQRIAAASGIMKFGMHDLRRSFCSNLAAVSVPLQVAQRLMRHSDPKLTAVVYTNAEDILGEAVEKLARRNGRHEAIAKLPATTIEQAGTKHDGQ